MPAYHCPGCGYPGFCRSAVCRRHTTRSENDAPLTDLRTLCIIVGCLTPRADANLCRSHAAVTNPWRRTNR